MSNQNSKIKEGFRIAEPGLLPEEWETISLGEVLEEVDYRVKDFGTNDIPVLSMTRYQGLILQNEKFEKRVASRDVNNYKVVRKGHIVYGFPMDEGVIYTLRKVDVGAVSPVYEVWKLISDIVDIEFLDQLLKIPLMISAYRRLTSNTVERRRIVSKRDFKRIIVSIPPHPEQKAITRVLSTIQKAVEAQDKIITAAREMKKSLMRHLFTYGPVAVAEAEKVPIKETEIGPVPEQWDVVKLGEYCNFTTGKLNSNQAVPNGKYPFFTCSQETFRIDRYSFDCEAVLLSGNNAQGKYSVKHYYGKFDAYQRTYVITIRDINSISYEYLKNALETKLEDLRIGSIGTSTKFLTLKMLLSLQIPKPSIDQQQKIAKILSIADNKIESEENRKLALQTLFKTMLHQLMTGEVRVKDLEAMAA
jgi:type I restriction enzyme S subunit